MPFRTELLIAFASILFATLIACVMVGYAVYRYISSIYSQRKRLADEVLRSTWDIGDGVGAEHNELSPKAVGGILAPYKDKIIGGAEPIIDSAFTSDPITMTKQLLGGYRAHFLVLTVVFNGRLNKNFIISPNIPHPPTYIVGDRSGWEPHGKMQDRIGALQECDRGLLANDLPPVLWMLPFAVVNRHTQAAKRGTTEDGQGAHSQTTESAVSPHQKMSFAFFELLALSEANDPSIPQIRGRVFAALNELYRVSTLLKEKCTFTPGTTGGYYNTFAPFPDLLMTEADRAELLAPIDQARDPKEGAPLAIIVSMVHNSGKSGGDGSKPVPQMRMSYQSSEGQHILRDILNNGDKIKLVELNALIRAFSEVSDLYQKQSGAAWARDHSVQVPNLFAKTHSFLNMLRFNLVASGNDISPSTVGELKGLSGCPRHLKGLRDSRVANMVLLDFLLTPVERAVVGVEPLLMYNGLVLIFLRCLSNLRFTLPVRLQKFLDASLTREDLKLSGPSLPQASLASAAPSSSSNAASGGLLNASRAANPEQLSPHSTKGGASMSSAVQREPNATNVSGRSSSDTTHERSQPPKRQRGGGTELYSAYAVEVERSKTWKNARSRHGSDVGSAPRGMTSSVSSSHLQMEGRRSSDSPHLAPSQSLHKRSRSFGDDLSDDAPKAADTLDLLDVHNVGVALRPMEAVL